MQADDVVEKNQTEKDADGELHRVVRRLRPAPRQQRSAAPFHVFHILERQPRVRHEKARAEQQKRGRNRRLNVDPAIHESTLSHVKALL